MNNFYYTGRLCTLGLVVLVAAATLGCTKTSDPTDTHGAQASEKTEVTAQHQPSPHAGTPGLTLATWGDTQRQVCPDPFTSPVTHVMGILIDRSGSVETQAGTMQRILHDAAELIPQLPTGTMVAIHYASDHSFSDSEAALVGVIPQASTTTAQCEAPDVDLQKKKHCARKQSQRAKKISLRNTCIQEIRTTMAQQILALTPEAAPQTDLHGGLHVLEEVFAAYPDANKTAILYTDLIDNRGLVLPTHMQGFEGTSIVIRYPRYGDSNRRTILEELQQRILNVEQMLMERGAKTFTAVPLSLPLQYKLVS